MPRYIFDVLINIFIIIATLLCRALGATNSNAASSRSHTVILASVSITAGDTTRKSTLYFADLAGSERQSASGAVGKRLSEAKHINKSLLNLSNVISKLAERVEGEHVPYRNSKLTRLLR
jgi:hypothetical protein